jgi:exodeoxyribonuclease VII large subunit
MDCGMSNEFPENTGQRDIYSVSRLNAEVRAVLGGSFPLLWVEGEISNLAAPRSGHLYFSLKDAGAQVRCAMFRMRRQMLRFVPDNGARVLVRARVNLYEPRGDFQLTVESMEPAGDGALRQAFEALKAKLAGEGLFSADRKRPIPAYVRQLGVITSPSGAAVRDVLSVLQRRYPALPVIIYPTVVQGDSAAGEIVRSIRLADQSGDCDLLILTRGGGSLEDLQAFNDEAVARAIANAQTPIISAVGHEIDFTIADFVADMRAATPSAAAEAASPDGVALRQRVAALQRRLQGAMGLGQTRQQGRLDDLRRRLMVQHPAQRLQQRQQRVDELEMRLRRTVGRVIELRRQLLANTVRRGGLEAVQLKLLESARLLRELDRRMARAMSNILDSNGVRLEAKARELHAISPLAILERGYSITRLDKSSKVLRSASELRPGDRLRTKLAEGEAISVVEKITELRKP